MRSPEDLRREIDARAEAEFALQAANNELTHANQFMQALLENLSDGIVACDQSGNLTLFNAAGNKCPVPFVRSTRRASPSQKVPDTYFPHSAK